MLFLIIIQPKIVDEDPITRKVDPAKMARAITRNTIAIIGSCVNVS